jgi:hypothetical protein
MMVRMAPLAAAGLLLLGGLNVCLSAMLYRQIAPDDASEEKAEWIPPVGKSVAPVAARKPIESYQLTLAHPVFFKSREPFVPPPLPPPPKIVQPVPPVVVDPGLILGGVMTNHDLRKAYLLTKANPAGSWVSEGESFMGWKVQSVDTASARLQQQDRTIELQLYPWN